jgi:hypothetical protein
VRCNTTHVFYSDYNDAIAATTDSTPLKHAHVCSRRHSMSRSTSQSSTATTTTTTHGLSRTQSVKTNTKTQSLNPLSASDIRLFVTNLRLLDLDLRSDWPGITVQTFSAKNADQKQRIGGAEWALFRLFEIWDAHDTAQVRPDV